MSDKRKKKEEIITKRSCRSIRRTDGLRMKTLREYTFRGFLEAVTSRYGERKAYSIYKDPESKDISYKAMKWAAESMGTYLLDHGIAKGDKVAILGESCPHWMCAYLGITYIGAVTVPILPDFSQSEVEEILRQSEAKAIVVNTRQHKKAEAYGKENKLMVFRMDDLVHIPTVPEGYTFQTAPGIAIKDVKAKQSLLSVSVPCEDDLASIIFTSGTTGSSKGVMLTHKNLLVCADEATDAYVKINPGDKVLSILPMSHCYEFITGHVLTLLCGADITFLGKPPATTILMAALSEVRPHIMLTVPLLIEKIYKAAVFPVITGDGKIAKLYRNPLTSWFVKASIRRKLVAKLGGRMKFFGIGGAPLDKEVEEFLFRSGFPYAPGYGLTETSPLIAASGPKKRLHRLGYIGKVVAHGEVKLLEKNAEGVGEIVFKGPNVMQGYYKRDDLNKEVFTEDGYFRTGDLGYVTKEGFLAVRGRIKTMILGPSGENIYPEQIESLINNMDYVEESLVVPSDSGLLALIKIDVKGMAEKMAISAVEAKAEAEKYLEKLKATVNKELNVASKISETELQETPFERTPTQKIKRFLYNRTKK